MSSSATGGGAVRSVEGEASPSVSPSMEGVLPIRGVDGSTGEALPICPATGLREASDLYRVDVVRWAALDVPSIMVEGDLTKLREEYRIPSDIDLILPETTERACFPRMGCTALHLNAFVSGMRLPLHPMFRRILRAYDLAPTQMPLEVFQTVYQPRKLPRKKGKEEEAGWYYFCPWGSHKPLVTGCPSSIKQWKESWFWVSGNWQRVVDDPEPDLDVPSVYRIASSLPRRELSRESIEVLRSIYQADSKSRSYSFILNRQRCFVELGLVASKGAGNKDVAGASNVIEVDDAPEVEVPLSRKRKAKSAETGVSQARGGAIDVDNTMGGAPPLQRTLAVNKSGEVVLEGPSRPAPAPGSGEGGPFDSKRRLRELIGSSGARIPDDSLQNVPFYPSMGAQAVKYYFTPKWEEFSSHGEVEDVLEASLASAIRASTLQMKVLGEFRIRMREQKKLAAQSSKADKEHQQAIEGLKAALESARTAYERMEADLKESDANLLNMTKQLDNANAAQKVAAEALEATNIEKRRLLEEAKSREEEVSSLRKELADAEKAKQEAEDGKEEVEAKLANAEADFMANFHNTEAYSNFIDYFARVGHQEVLTALRNDHPLSY
ncbi:Plus3 domain-containing protein [Abeliophyllum distichum]|uniref:Plus3 domain-containing protein n=1 Tax=Abeliophyllum distichum TaxID=126358 RepID=A0ABD1R9K5_9LAMI